MPANPFILIVWIVALAILVGLALWAIPQVVLDPMIQKWARLAVIVVVVLAIVWLLLTFTGAMPVTR